MPSRHRALRSVAAALSLAALTLGGCTSEPENRPMSAIPSPTTTTPSSTTTVVPTTATPEDPLDASLAVVRAYMDAYGPGLRDGDGSVLAALATSSCKTCANAVEKLNAYDPTGPKPTGGDISLTLTEVRGEPSETRVVWHVGYTQTASGFAQADGTVTITEEQDSGFANFDVTLVSDRWLINAIRPDTEAAG